MRIKISSFIGGFLIDTGKLQIRAHFKGPILRVQFSFTACPLRRPAYSLGQAITCYLKKCPALGCLYNVGLVLKENFILSVLKVVCRADVK